MSTIHSANNLALSALLAGAASGRIRGEASVPAGVSAGTYALEVVTPLVGAAVDYSVSFRDTGSDASVITLLFPTYSGGVSTVVSGGSSVLQHLSTPTNGVMASRATIKLGAPVGQWMIEVDTNVGSRVADVDFSGLFLSNLSVNQEVASDVLSKSARLRGAFTANPSGGKDCIVSFNWAPTFGGSFRFEVNLMTGSAPATSRDILHWGTTGLNRILIQANTDGSVGVHKWGGASPSQVVLSPAFPLYDGKPHKLEVFYGAVGCIVKIDDVELAKTAVPQTVFNGSEYRHFVGGNLTGSAPWLGAMWDVTMEDLTTPANTIHLKLDAVPGDPNTDLNTHTGSTAVPSTAIGAGVVAAPITAKDVSGQLWVPVVPFISSELADGVEIGQKTSTVLKESSVSIRSNGASATHLGTELKLNYKGSASMVMTGKISSGDLEAPRTITLTASDDDFNETQSTSFRLTTVGEVVNFSLSFAVVFFNTTNKAHVTISGLSADETYNISYCCTYVCIPSVF